MDNNDRYIYTHNTHITPKHQKVLVLQRVNFVNSEILYNALILYIDQIQVLEL